jgi:hypothetical protein
MMEAVKISETSVSIYQTARHNIPEDSHLHTHCREDLKSHHVNHGPLGCDALLSQEVNNVLEELIASIFSPEELQSRSVCGGENKDASDLNRVPTQHFFNHLNEWDIQT